MSSVDSALLSGASYLTHNLLPSSSSKRISPSWAFRLSALLLAVASAALSLSANTVYGLWALPGDLEYVVVFPQFLAAAHLAGRVNGAGSAAGIAVSKLKALRMSCWLVAEIYVALKNTKFLV